MRCDFCGDPSAHPATGAVYTAPRSAGAMLACHRCVTTFWAWARSHMRARRGTDFAAAAGRWSEQERVALAASKAAP